MKTFLKMLVAAIVAAGMAVVLVAHGASVNVIVAVYFGAAITIALALCAFDSADKSASEEGRVKSKEFTSAAKKGYGQAAVFIGTAAIFMGTLAECEEVADDLWHYAQQAEVRTLTGEETLEVL